jgi:hypothetical protein
MADLEFSRDDIVSLIEKISTLQPDFSDQELQLLMSIFTLAAEHTIPSGEQPVPLQEPPIPGEQAEGDGPATVDELRNQLLQAYIPDSSLHSVAESGPQLPASYGIYYHSIHRIVGPPHGIHLPGGIDLAPEE